jgi:hypothetical protein
MNEYLFCTNLKYVWVCIHVYICMSNISMYWMNCMHSELYLSVCISSLACALNKITSTWTYAQYQNDVHNLFVNVVSVIYITAENIKHKNAISITYTYAHEGSLNMNCTIACLIRHWNHSQFEYSSGYTCVNLSLPSLVFSWLSMLYNQLRQGTS